MNDATARGAEAEPLDQAPRVRLRLVSDRTPRLRPAGRLRGRLRDSRAGEIILLLATLGLVTVLVASLHHAIEAPGHGALPMSAPAW